MLTLKYQSVGSSGRFSHDIKTKMQCRFALIVDVNVMKGQELIKNWADTEVRIRELLIKLKLVEK